MNSQLINYIVFNCLLLLVRLCGIRSAHTVPVLRQFGKRRHRSALVNIFYHIRQEAARVAKLVLVGAFETSILGKGVRRWSAIVPFERTMVVSYR